MKNEVFIKEDKTMGTVVTVPKERQKPINPAEFRINDEMDRRVFSRYLIENVRRWIEDPTQDKLVNFGMGSGSRPKLSPEQIDRRVKFGAGRESIHTVIEPADLELYRSYMYPPLSMPEKPEVMISCGDSHNRIVPFMEDRIMVKAMCPDGIESWLVISAPVLNFYIALEGNCWGWPKYVADEMTVSPTRAEVVYEGKVRLSLDFTPGVVDEATVKELEERGRWEGGNTVSFHVYKGGGMLIRQGTGGVGGHEDVKYVEWQAGMVKTYIRPEDRESGLIPANCVTPGVYEKSFSTGGGEGGMYKVKG